MRAIGLIMLLFCSVQVFAQTTLPNMDLESWQASASGRYEDPMPTTLWATPNYIMDLILGSPSTSVVQKSTDRHGGNYAALMKSRTVLGNFVGATLFTGKLNTSNLTNPIPLLGVPFTGRPVALKGWMKYTSVNGDSSSMYIKLTRWNSSTNSRETVGFYEDRKYASITSYTAFTLPVAYSTSATPDSVTLVFSSSAGAEQRQGQVGSSLWIDDLVFEYPTGFLQPIVFENEVNIFPNPANSFIQFTNAEKVNSVKIFSAKLDEVAEFKSSKSQSRIDISSLAEGNYFIQFYDENNQLKGFHSFIKQ